ncbi:hypothetical protein SAMN05216206_2751 [Pseudomonas guineae]|uniref:Uncharacterized protein n=1 Tax=Pseudomonas guineae TaxID=425504 RepID=A0A1I3K8T6_9PSED|nr:hypothetical protein [Pseudomonas guineae]SFI68902.1 hypothetical protein SAMN05216206_2751 [Pseudomonas guineae]
MATKISTGLANYLLGVGSLRQAMQGAVIRVYSGQEPQAADSSLPGDAVLLAEFSVDGTGAGLSLQPTATGAVIAKNPDEAWRATAVGTGTASWFRWTQPSDAGGSGSTYLRLQGAVSVSGAELNFSSLSFAQGAIQKVDYFAVAMPAN